jgi:hypothetical protein
MAERTEMTLAGALITQAGPYMVAAKAQALTAAEVSKGCDGQIPHVPVALEPVFHPIVMTKDLMALQDRPHWVLESPPEYQELVRYRVWLSPDQPFNWNGLELFVKQLSLVSHRVGLEIAGNRERISIAVLCHRSDVPLVTTAFSSKLRFCRLSVEAEEPVFDAEPEVWRNIGLYEYFPPPPYYHLLTRPDELHTSPYEALITAMADTPPPAKGIYQVLFQPVSAANNWHRNIEVLTDLEYVVKLLNNTGHTQRYAQQAPSGALGQMAGDVETKAHNDKPLYSAVFRVALVGVDDDSQNYLQSLGVFTSLFQHGGRPLNFITQSQYKSVLSVEQIRQMFLLGLTYRPGFLVNSAELTGLVHFPDVSIAEQLDTDIDQVETLSIITGNRLSEGTPIGTTTVAGRETTVCIPQELRCYGTHLVGKPGRGKSTVEERMIIDDIRKRHGVAVVDPHHDLIDRLLSLIPQEDIDRVIYFNPADPDWVPLWNPMQRIAGQDIGRITADLISVLKSFVQGWGDRMEHLFRQSIRGLLHLQGTCLRDVYDILCSSDESKEIRKLVLEVIQDGMAHHFWKQEIDEYRPDELGPPKNKLSKLLLSNTTVSLMFSQTQSAFNFRRMMDDGMIFLADLSSSLGKEVTEVVGGFIVALMHISALSRSDLPREQRRPFHIYLDEAYRFVTDSLEEIITEAPKYGVSLTLAHQFLQQFDTKKIHALGSIGTTIVFNVDSGDASYLSKGFKNRVKIDDFVNLERGEAIVRCGTEIAKIETLGPLEIPEQNFKDRIIAESRKKYCMPVSQVCRIIEQRRERANKPFAPLGVVADNRSNAFLPREFQYDEL